MNVFMNVNIFHSSRSIIKISQRTHFMISTNKTIDKNNDDNYIYEIYDDAYNRCVTTTVKTVT